MKRLENMIDKIMNIMQTETANLILHKESVILSDLLAEITTTIQPILAQRNIVLDKEAVDDHVLVSADKTHMTGAIYNIMDNAIKYGGDHIEIKLAAKGDQAVLEIRDNGQGISSGYHKKVFEHFFRVPSGNKHDVKGHGLGLSYARQIIEAHGGNIRLESSAGNGAAFIIVLPQFHIA
jgi:signal transduction histidine kinase